MKKENKTKQKSKSPGLAQVSIGLVTGRDLNKRIYTVPDLIRLTGLTRKQITYWASVRLLTPHLRNSKACGSQPSSFYSAVDVVKALIICDIRKRGFSLQQVQKVIRNLEKHGLSLDKSEPYLLTDGYTVYYAENDNEVIDILKHRGQMLLVAIHEKIERLKQAA